MQVEVDVIAKKYAVAFLDLYINEFTDECLDKIIELEDFLKKNKMFYVYLRIPSISLFIKQKALNRIAEKLELPRNIKRMMFVLLDQRRIEILDDVLKQIIICCRRMKNIKLFKVYSSHSITEEEKKSVIKFIKSVTNAGVVANFYVDERLICGLRIQSYTFLWERSIAKQLRDIKRFIFKQVESW